MEKKRVGEEKAASTFGDSVRTALTVGSVTFLGVYAFSGNPLAAAALGVVAFSGTLLICEVTRKYLNKAEAAQKEKRKEYENLIKEG